MYSEGSIHSPADRFVQKTKAYLGDSELDQHDISHIIMLYFFVMDLEQICLPVCPMYSTYFADTEV